ncbi:MAG: hypothetical protein HN348_12145 [Proteobacteria bacterium]|jgi:predicted RNA-binding protein YlxR (DUF448 family)|nr:hypothetical protein [Pseudomonadota bacterium]
MDRPQRSCIVCRQRSGSADLLRLSPDALKQLRVDAISRLTPGPPGSVARDSSIGNLCFESASVALRPRIGGRGVYVHYECVGRLVRKPGALLGFFKSDLQLERAVRHAVRAAMGTALERAALSGTMISGHQRILAAFEKQLICDVVVASDASSRSVKALSAQANPDLPITVVPFDMDELGRHIRRSPRFAAGVVASRSSVDLQRQLHRWRGLG